MKFTRANAKSFEKHGAKMKLYFDTTQLPQANFLEISVNKGHLEEFYHDKSAFIYYVLRGSGSFFLNGKELKVKATDVVAVPPKTKIYYLGKMKLLLVTAPGWTQENEHHARFIQPLKKAGKK